MKLFIRPWCGWCQEAMEWLDRHGYKYEKLNIELDDKAGQEMMSLSRQSRVPTLVVGDKVLPDFDTGQLEVFLKKNGIFAS